MKNINIFMADREYAKSLNNILNKKYDDISSKLIYQLDDREKNSLLLTDQNIPDKTCLKLLTDQEKFQSIDKIYQEINSAYKSVEIWSSDQEIIVFVNIGQIKAENKIASKIAIESNKKMPSLLVNFNYFNSYFQENEFSLDSLLFIKSINEEIAVNKGKEIDYISSSKLIFETNELENITNILTILKKQDYKRLVFDLSFFISKRNLEIIKSATKIIYYSYCDQNYSFFKKNIKFINKHIKENIKTCYIFEKATNFEVVNIDEKIIFDDFSRMVEYLC